MLSSESINPGYATLQKPVQIIEDGPFRSIIESYFVCNHSNIVQRYIINKRSAVIELELGIFWAEKDKMLKLAYTPAHQLNQLWAEKCYSIDEETNAVSEAYKERTFQHFLRRTDGVESIGIISHGTHGYHQDDNTTWLSVLRSPAYACMAVAADWQRYRNRYIPHQDQGERQARFTFVFGKDASSNEGMARKAYEYNVGLDSLVYFPTKRDVQATAKASFITTDTGNVILSAMKKSEEDDALILRFWETAGCDTDFDIAIGQRSFKAHIGAFCLKTYRLDRESGAMAEVNLLECG